MQPLVHAHLSKMSAKLQEAAAATVEKPMGMKYYFMFYVRFLIPSHELQLIEFSLCPQDKNKNQGDVRLFRYQFVLFLSLSLAFLFPLLT